MLIMGLAIQWLLVSSSYAQIPTSITPTTGNFAQGNLNTQIADPRIEGVNTVHDIIGGTRPSDGSNLFHSFDKLSVGEQHIANFLNETGFLTENILSRVTGGDPSKIFGTLQTTGFPDANLFLLNPAGVVFGPNAKVDIKGAFYASTANFLKLGQDGVFYADLAENSVLTAAAPKAFGFLSANPPQMTSKNSEAIFVDGLEIKNGRSVSLVSRDAIAGEDALDGIIISEGTVQSQNGRVTLLSIAASQVTEIKQISVDIKTLGAQAIDDHGKVIPETVQLGGITLKKGAQLDTSGYGGGTVVIQGGKLLVEESKISANVTGANNTDSTPEAQTGIDIFVTDTVTISKGSILETNVQPDATPGIGSGGVRIVADQVTIQGTFQRLDTGIQSIVTANSKGGKSGNIEVRATSFQIENLGFLQAITSGNADGGDIHLLVDSNLKIASSVVGTRSLGAGDSGNIKIKIQEGELSIHGAFITSQTVETSGNAGNISISVEKGSAFINGGNIFSSITGIGSGGNIEFVAQNLELINDSQIQVNNFSPVMAGEVNVTLSGNLKVQKGSGIANAALNTADSGNLTISAKDIVIAGIVTTRSTNEGRGGTVNIRAQNITVTNDGRITSEAEASGDGGNIEVTADSLSLINRASITAASSSTGSAGNVLLNVNNLTVKGASEITSSSTSQESNAGGGGTIEVNAANFINLAASKVSTSVTGGSKSGGDIKLTAGQDLLLSDSMTVTAESTSTSTNPGNAGAIMLNGNDSVFIENSTVTTRAQNAVAGDINVEAENLIQITNSEIVSEVPEGAGSAGRINIDPQFIVVQNSLIDSTANFGDGGDVTFVADSAILIDPFSTIDTSSQFGGSGTVDIRAPIQNLGESIAPLPEEILKVSGLFAARCAAQKGGKFSSFVPGRFGGTPPGFSGYLSSPLTFSTSNFQDSTTTVPRVGIDDKQEDTKWRFLNISQATDFSPGCSTVLASYS
ncbi:MAG: hypothetical protein DHS20C17_31940 [Cyclobacteriaceae bacterium]|nr:MAG: hypothetical protein DHS20C17_31940 [Cyclobacteriaceae bacterium]